MAVYKVIQDIEAEDHLLGPLTLKGFIYAAIAVLLGYINFRLLTVSALGPVKWLFILAFFFPMVLFGVLASPLGREQPTEVWLLARVRFMLKPKTRIWNPMGVIELVKITVPKKEELHLTKDFDKDEAVSRLQALAQTLDSHGWAIKNAVVNLNTAPGYTKPLDDKERLVPTSDLARTETPVDVHAADDILDTDNNPVAQKVNNLMQEAEQERKIDLQMRLEAARDEFANAEVVADHSIADAKSADEQKILDEMHQRAKVFSPVTPQVQAVKMELAQSGNAFSVATLANLAKRTSPEIVVPLH